MQSVEVDWEVAVVCDGYGSDGCYFYFCLHHLGNLGARSHRPTAALSWAVNAQLSVEIFEISMRNCAGSKKIKSLS